MRKTRKINIREGKSIFDGYEENEIEFWRPFYKRALEGRSSKTIKEENIRDTFYSFEISFNPILKAENQVTGVTVFIKDITAQQEAEQQMKQQNDELLKVNNELDRFVYSVSHDLRAPLSSILGLINIARMEGLEPPHQNYYEMIEKSIRKLDEFIGDIINYSRNSRLHINKESIWFQPLIEDIFNSIALNEYPVNPKLTVSVQQNIPYFSDKERLSMILENLISNAVRYQKSDEPNPSVKVNVIVKPKAAFIDVTDNGDGIEEEYQEKVFNMFYRASEKTTGSGLGLYIVNESLKKLGGKISVHSKSGEGSTFSIEVPNLSGQPQ